MKILALLALVHGINALAESRLVREFLSPKEVI